MWSLIPIINAELLCGNSHITMCEKAELSFLSAKKYVPPGGSGSEFCQTEESGAEQCPDGEGGGSSKDFGSMGIIFLGIFITGFANSLFYAFGKSCVNVNIPWYGYQRQLHIRYSRHALY